MLAAAAWRRVPSTAAKISPATCNIACFTRLPFVDCPTSSTMIPIVPSIMPLDTPAPVFPLVPSVWTPTSSFDLDGTMEQPSMWAMNRNVREPKKPNHGKRPCSNRRRKRKMRLRSNDHPFMSIKQKKGIDA